MGQERRACRRVLKSRCQRNTASGRTSSRRWFSTPRGEANWQIKWASHHGDGAGHGLIGIRERAEAATAL